MPDAFQIFLLLMPEILGGPFNFLNTNALAEQWFRKPPNFHVDKKKARLSQDAAEVFRA
jgi:hypothetical protein